MSYMTSLHRLWFKTVNLTAFFLNRCIQFFSFYRKCETWNKRLYPWWKSIAHPYIQHDLYLHVSVMKGCVVKFERCIDCTMLLHPKDINLTYSKQLVWNCVVFMIKVMRVKITLIFSIYCCV